MNTNTLYLRVAYATLPLQMLLSRQLWWPDAKRSFPTLPIWGETALPDWCSVLLSSMLVLNIGIWLFRPNNTRLFSTLSFAFLLVLCCMDLHRLQVWVWMWLLLFGWSAFMGKNSTGPALIITGIYFWSGLNKCTPWFTEDVFVQFTEAFAWTRFLAKTPDLGYILAGVEILIGIGLLWKPMRRIALWIAVVLHTYIIVVLSPLGLNWNPVVIPWNIALPLLAWHYFGQQDFVAPFSNKNMPSRAITVGSAVLFLLCWIAPAGRFEGFWPETLSWNLYSNTQPEATIYAPEGVACPQYAEIWNRLADEGKYLLVDDWALDELHVPAFSSVRSWKSAAYRLSSCQWVSDSTIQLLVLRVAPWDKKKERPIERVPL